MPNRRLPRPDAEERPSIHADGWPRPPPHLRWECRLAGSNSQRRVSSGSTLRALAEADASLCHQSNYPSLSPDVDGRFAFAYRLSPVGTARALPASAASLRSSAAMSAGEQQLQQLQALTQPQRWPQSGHSQSQHSRQPAPQVPQPQLLQCPVRCAQGLPQPSVELHSLQFVGQPPNEPVRHPEQTVWAGRVHEHELSAYTRCAVAIDPNVTEARTAKPARMVLVRKCRRLVERANSSRPSRVVFSRSVMALPARPLIRSYGRNRFHRAAPL